MDDSADFVQDLRSMASCPACSPMGGVGANGVMASAVGSPVRVWSGEERMLCEVVPRSALITMQDSGCEFRRMGERGSSASEFPVLPAAPTEPRIRTRRSASACLRAGNSGGHHACYLRKSRTHSRSCVHRCFPSDLEGPVTRAVGRVSLANQRFRSTTVIGTLRSLPRKGCRAR